MSGHSKWSTIKHRKASQDAKRGKAFTKLIREITVSVKAGGNDTKSNPRLRLAMLQARSFNMPNDTIQRAIKKGMGSGVGSDYEEAIYEGYALEKVAVMVATLTDNRNRTAADIRYLFSKFGGNLGGANSVRHLFTRSGVLLVQTTEQNRLTEVAIEAGAEDLENQQEQYQVLCAVDKLEQLRTILEENKFNVSQASLEWLPNSPMVVEKESSIKQILEFLESLEEHDDVQQVFSNLELPDYWLEKSA